MLFWCRILRSRSLSWKPVLLCDDAVVPLWVGAQLVQDNASGPSTTGSVIPQGLLPRDLDVGVRVVVRVFIESVSSVAQVVGIWTPDWIIGRMVVFVYEGISVPRSRSACVLPVVPVHNNRQRWDNWPWWRRCSCQWRSCGKLEDSLARPDLGYIVDATDQPSAS